MFGEADQDRIIYRSDAVHPRHQANFRVFDPLDFLADVSARGPTPRFQYPIRRFTLTPKKRPDPPTQPER